MGGVWDNNISNNKKYDKLINNLLLIKSSDQTIFTKINNKSSFDIPKKFSNSIATKIINQKQFKFKLNEVDIDELIKIVKQSEDAKTIIESFKTFNKNISIANQTLLLNTTTFIGTKQEIINDLIESKQKENVRWKQFRRKVLDSNIQDNIWPLHVATLFISKKCGDKVIYAPLLLKEVQLDIDINLVSEETWKLNEKVIFLLKDEGIQIDESVLKDANDNVEIIINNIFTLLNIKSSKINLTDSFINYKRDEIKNSHVVFHPGLVLGLFKPSGGYLRRIMKEIIDNNEIDNILNVDPEKMIYEKRVEESILDCSDKLVHIQPSNFSQDKALISSLIQDTIIWGPPGTGKSQVIANIIANILLKDKKAIVLSQKKAALDVLKKRLKNVAPFVLFILNDNNMIKDEFYKPLKKFVELVEYSEENNIDIHYKIISEEELEMLEIINNLKSDGKYDVTLKALEVFKDNLEILEIAYKLDSKYKYSLDFTDENSFYKKFTEINDIQSKSFLGYKWIPNNIKNISGKALPFLSYIKEKMDNQDPNLLLEIINKTNLDNVKKLVKCYITKKHKREFKNKDSQLANILANKIRKTIVAWKKVDHASLEEYKKFANAVRAARAIPFKFLNDHIKIIRALFPVIVTTPETNFINWQKNYFHYAILDESSQMFIEVGLPILYLAKIKILAGDQKQMKPASWFTTRYSVDLEEDDIDVEENAISLLDYAMDKGVYSVMLDQNFRSKAAALMSFSSKVFYDSKLSVVDNKVGVDINPIEVINVSGKWDNGVNQLEAQKVIETYKKIVEKYDNVIILTFNSNQRQLIEKEILENHPDISKNMENEKLSIRNIENIQGDEADIVIASIVYDKTTNMHSTYVARDGGQNALNVAISRAKSKMIVIKSLAANELKTANSEDFKIFREWLIFLDLKSEEQKSFSNLESHILEEGDGETESSFERDVLDFLVKNLTCKKAASIQKQYKVGSYKIDLAIVDNSSNDFIIGIEVDGYKYHSGYKKYLADKARQEFLEAKGYGIYRIKEIDFKINKENIANDINRIINSF